MKNRIAAFAAAAAILSAGVCAPAAGISPFSVTAEAASASLPAPTGLLARYGKNSVSLSWNAVKGADAYRVYQYDAATKKFKSVKTVKSTSCSVNGLKTGTLYQFKVAPLKKNGSNYKLAGKKSETVKCRTLYTFRKGNTENCTLFYYSMPAEVSYHGDTTDTGITIYDPSSVETGYGGLVFEITAYEDPGEWYGMMDHKVGEIHAMDGTVYDIVIRYPSDVQYNYNIYGTEMPANYFKLYTNAENVAKSIDPKSHGKFIYGAGCKGEDLYKDVLKKHKKAVSEGWDSKKLEAEDMSVMNNIAAQNIGYAYKDLNGDGIDELVIGENAGGESVIYDVYTIVDRKPAHVLSGWDRNRYYAADNGYLANEYSGGAAESGVRVYEIRHNEAEPAFMYDFNYNGIEDPSQPFSVSYDGGETYEHLSEEDFTERSAAFKGYEKISFKPFSSLR